MRKVIFALVLTAFMAAGAYATQDVASESAPANLHDGTWPILGTIPLDMNDYCVGVGFDGTYLWVSAGDQATGFCEFYIYDEYGTQVANVTQGGGATGWGHRDMAWNGSYMFGSFSTMVDGFGPDYMFAGYFIGALNPNRALAHYGNNVFYTCGFGEQLTRMEWDGVWGSAAATTYLGSWDGAYGLAYDCVDDVLIMSTADYSGNIFILDPATGFLISTATSLPEYDIAGGCTMADTAQFGFILVVLQQSAPDTLVFYDLGHTTPSPAETGSWGAIKAMYR
jgi:hypothetical protein